MYDLGRPEVSEVSLMTAHNLTAMEIITELNEGQESGDAFFQSRDECEKTIFELVRHEDMRTLGYALDIKETGVFARQRGRENGREVFSTQIACVSVAGDFLQPRTK